MVYTNSGLRYTKEDSLFKGRGSKGSARPAADTVDKAVWRGEVSMKSRKHVLKIAAFFAVVAMLLGCTISTWARDIKKGYRVYPGHSSFGIELDSGESISKIKVNKKGLKLKVMKNNFSENKVVDKAKNAAWNSTHKDDPVKDSKTVYLIANSTKAGKYKVTFNIKKGKKTTKKKQKITVYVGSAVSSVKFAGKSYKTLGKYQGSKYDYPFYSASSFVTKKSKGKFSAKAGYGYKVVGISYRKYDAKTEEWDDVAYKSGASVPLYKGKTYKYNYEMDWAGAVHSYMDSPYYSRVGFTIYLKDTINPKNNDSTSKFAKGKYSTEYYVYFYKY